MTRWEVIIVFVLLIAIAFVLYHWYNAPVLKTGGGASSVIHIGGPEASGKSTMAAELKKALPDVGIYDLDDLSREYETCELFNTITYPDFVNSKIRNHAETIFVGLPCQLGKGNSYFDLPADEKYAIELDIDINVKRLYMREVNAWANWFSGRDKEILYDQLRENEACVRGDLACSISRPLAISAMHSDIQTQVDWFAAHGYKFLSYDDILRKVTAR